MRSFHCDHCGRLIYFENVTCTNCGHALAFVPELLEMASFEVAGDGSWRSPKVSLATPRRPCLNYTQNHVCNWVVEGSDEDPLCKACRLTLVIPNLDKPGNREAWYELESAKRRLLYQLMRLGLPLRGRREDPDSGPAFEFKEDAHNGDKVLTGHADGLVTINIAEADPVERERRRKEMGEPYRTLLGHFRHEIAHYYWDILVRPSPGRLTAFRGMFGDEQPDYSAALKAHYENGAPADWQERFVSRYASSHPWEDWAETFAHYLHLSGALETAAANGLHLHPAHPQEPRFNADPVHTGHPVKGGFKRLADDWLALSYLLNNLARSIGHSDSYPFVLSPKVVEKLGFVHDTLAGAAAG